LVEKTFRWFASFSEKKPWVVIAAIAVITLLAMAGAARIHQELGYKTMLPKNYESVKAINVVEEEFGGVSEENILIEADDVLRADILRAVAGYPAYLKENQELWGTFASEVVTPLDQMYYFPPDSSVPSQEPLSGKVASLSDEELTAQVERNIAYDREQKKAIGMVGGFIGSISLDRQAILLRVKMNPDLPTKDQIKLAEPLVNYTTEYFEKLPGAKAYISGPATQNRDSNNMMMKDTMFLFLLAFLFIIIVLYITFRRLTDVLLTLAVIVVTIIWVEGLSGWLGFPFTYASSAIMPLLLGIDIAYAIHVMSRYYEERRKGNDPYVSTVTSVVTVGVAVFLTAATTAFGFVSFGISSMPPIIQFGMLCVAGVMISFVLAITLLPATIVLRDRSPRAQERWARRQAKKSDRMGESWLDKSLAKLSVLSEHHRVIVGIVTVCIVVACIILSFRMTTEADMNSMMPKDTPSAIAQTEITHFFGGQDIGITLVSGDIMQPANLQSMLEYEDLISSTGEYNSNGNPLIERRKVMSIADIVLIANQGTIPATREQVLQSLMAVSSGGGGGGSSIRLINQDLDTAMVSIYLERGTQSDMQRATEVMRSAGKQVTEENPDISMTYTGMPVLMTDIMSTIVPTQLKTSGLALILCALIVILVFKSVFFGLAATSVVFISIAVEMGALVILGWPLDFMTVMVSSLVIGAGIDFGIHVTHRFREEWHFGGVEIDEAIRRTIGNVGKALVAAAITTAGAFAIIGTSRIVFMRRFGVITALSLTVALLCSLLVLPSILAWRAQGVERKRKANGAIEEAEAPAEVEG
jgi:predicted RND superfamily exporter protein